MKMTMSLPRQIVLLGLLGFSIFISALWISVYLVKWEMNKKAEIQSVSLLSERIRLAQEQVMVIASDYNNWSDVYIAAVSGDIRKIASNYGITAARGDVFQYAVMFDGSFPKPVAWTAGNGLNPQETFLSTHTMDMIRSRIVELDISKRETMNFFDVLDGRIVMMSASYLQPENKSPLSVGDGPPPIAAIGKILTMDRLLVMSRELALTSLAVTDGPPAAGVFAPLRGIDGTEVAYLSWNPPEPGSQLFSSMAPILAIVTIFVGLLTSFATRLVNSRAATLVREEATSRELARTDALTGLPNRLAFYEALDAVNGEIGILVVDLNRFKQINDVLGHAGGDEFLQIFSRKFGMLTDSSTFVGRMGGDEFVAVFVDPENVGKLVEEKNRMLEGMLSEPVSIGGFQFDLSLSRGVAIARTETLEPRELLRRADKAMYFAKKHRMTEVAIYDPPMEAIDSSERVVEKALRRALVRSDEFYVAYQPIVAPNAPGKLVRVEALVRWNSKLLGPVPPGRFIRIAETSGLIHRIGNRVIDIVCGDLALNERLHVSINVSPNQLMVPNFANDLINRMKIYGIDSSRIQIELTENIAIHDDDDVFCALNCLKQHGFTIALDDFGTGFSSISYLAKMPFDVIKIDRSFISGPRVDFGQDSLAFVMILLARTLGIKVVAEGVETEGELLALEKGGCDLVQGYHIGRPQPLRSIIDRYLAPQLIPA